MARQLIDLGADPNQADSYDNLPLSMALFSQNMQLVNYLVDHGADIHKVGAVSQSRSLAACTRPDAYCYVNSEAKPLLQWQNAYIPTYFLAVWKR